MALLSSMPSRVTSAGIMQAAATTGPASGPLPASSMPATCLNPCGGAAASAGAAAAAAARGCGGRVAAPGPTATAPAAWWARPPWSWTSWPPPARGVRAAISQPGRAIAEGTARRWLSDGCRAGSGGAPAPSWGRRLHRPLLLLPAAASGRSRPPWPPASCPLRRRGGDGASAGGHTAGLLAVLWSAGLGAHWRPASWPRRRARRRAYRCAHRRARVTIRGALEWAKRRGMGSCPGPAGAARRSAARAPHLAASAPLPADAAFCATSLLDRRIASAAAPRIPARSM